MKMKLGVTWCYLLFMLINHKSSNLLVSAKSLETENLACHEHVGDFFKSFLNVTIEPSTKVGKCVRPRCSFNTFSPLSLIRLYLVLCYNVSGILVFVYRTGNPS